jgi:hypothetical protein
LASTRDIIAGKEIKCIIILKAVLKDLEEYAIYQAVEQKITSIKEYQKIVKGLDMVYHHTFSDFLETF